MAWQSAMCVSVAATAPSVRQRQRCEIRRGIAKVLLVGGWGSAPGPRSDQPTAPVQRRRARLRSNQPRKRPGGRPRTCSIVGWMSDS